MSWNFDKENWVDKVMRLTKILSITPLKYYELFEPTKHDNLFKRMEEISKLLSEDEDAGCKALDELLEIWENDVARISVPISAKEIKQIHVTKEQLKIGEQKYRDIMNLTVGKVSSNDLKHFESMLVLRALHDSNKSSKQ